MTTLAPTSKPMPRAWNERINQYANKEGESRIHVLIPRSSIVLKINGTAKSVDWMNPHLYVNIEAKENGKDVVYSVEGGPPNALFRQGWRPYSLKIGDKVQVSGVRAKKPESYRIGQAQITMPDGRIF